ncbi:uncharacterized protein LOC126265264 [Aethina tumida]|uniref:uncharacterized protein LOC126265264 n=1 Tax=Aethina tumida TaxID=116153 RepID=UPI002147E3AB|nr:uncharacterized protein LOC126265264 [Aethina tumida]
MIPQIVALILTCFEVYYRDLLTANENGPILSCYLFLFSTFLISWQAKILLDYFRLTNPMKCFLEFLLAYVFIEYELLYVWMPLEKMLINYFESEGISFIYSFGTLIIILFATRVITMATFKAQAEFLSFRIIRYVRAVARVLRRRRND